MNDSVICVSFISFFLLSGGGRGNTFIFINLFLFYLVSFLFNNSSLYLQHILFLVQCTSYDWQLSFIMLVVWIKTSLDWLLAMYHIYSFSKEHLVVDCNFWTDENINQRSFQTWIWSSSTGNLLQLHCHWVLYMIIMCVIERWLK